MDKTKKNVLKQVASDILEEDHYFQGKHEQWYRYIVDIIDTKLYKPITREGKKSPKNICKIYFSNKGMEDIRLTKILRSPDIVSLLPPQMQQEDDIPMVSYKLQPPIRNKIYNYKETVSSIHVDENGSFNSDLLPCDCDSSDFTDPHHKHIITGDLRIVQNPKLRKLLTKGQNYREPHMLNYGNCQTTINEAIDNFALQNGQNGVNLDEWRTAVKNKVTERVRYLKQTRTPSRTLSTLKNPEVIRDLELLKTMYVIVPIDKAPNNFAFVCKRYYISRLLKEVGIPNGNCDTYKLSSLVREIVVSDNIELCQKLGLNVPDKSDCLPIMYWLPKIHKTPSDARFIVASSVCSTKPLSSTISRLFKLIFQQVQSFHDKSTFYSRYKKFWVVENSYPVIQKMEQINKKSNAKCISTFDFKTLYTKIGHDNLLDVLNDIIDMVFKGGKNKFIMFNEYRAFWVNKKKGKCYFSKSSLKNIVKHLITECHFEIGNTLFTQVIGIPMGIDPAPFWANLYLYWYENKFMTKTIKENKFRAMRYHGSSRFIDDMCCINDSNDFEKSFKQIYPPSMELKIEHHGQHATFLDLEIDIRQGIFVYKLYDKRDAFPFFIVRMPDLTGNIPSSMFYGSILSEFLRIARTTLYINEFSHRASELVSRMCNQGGKRENIYRQLKKAALNHPEAFLKYRKSAAQIIESVVQL